VTGRQRDFRHDEIVTEEIRPLLQCDVERGAPEAVQPLEFGFEGCNVRHGGLLCNACVSGAQKESVRRDASIGGTTGHSLI
jgi:hypothetical protein